MSYYNSLSPEQKQNIDYIAAELQRAGITNRYVVAAILAVVSKESTFRAVAEQPYSNTSNERIRAIFSSTRSLTDAQLTALKANPKAFFDHVYGGRFGNAVNEGYKYRGRGYNQLTFKANYLSVGQRIGIDLVANPDLLLDPKIAAKALVIFYVREFEAAAKRGILSRYGVSSISNIGDINTALNIAFAANAGWPQKIETATGGYSTAKSRVNEFYSALDKLIITVSNTVKGNGLAILGTLFFLQHHTLPIII